MLPFIAFGILSAVALVSGIMVITRRNAIHSVIWLIVTLFAVGGIFLLQHAEFLFAVQVILYVGGIMVLFIFVIMLVNLDVAARQIQFNRQAWVGGILALALGAEVFMAFRLGANAFRLPSLSVRAMQPNAELVGVALFQRYMLPFEIASILLLVAMIGAVVLSKRKI